MFYAKPLIGLRLQLEEHGPEIFYIKGIHKNIADAILWLGYDPSVNQAAESYFTTKANKNPESSNRQNWMAVSKSIVQTKSRHQQT
jgi:hypothetical protein